MTIQIQHWIQDLDMSVFAERLRLLRQARNITQARLAELLEVSPRVYNRWEKGGNVPHFDTIVKIADILQVALDELAGRQEPSQDLKIRNYELRQIIPRLRLLAPYVVCGLRVVGVNFTVENSLSIFTTT